MNIGKRAFLAVAVFAALGGELAIAAAPALAAKAHSYESQLSGTPLTEPFGVAVNPTTGQAYVADKSTSIISVFNAKGEFESQFTDPFSAPRAITVNPVTNDVYVSAGEGEPTVTEFDATGTFIRSLTGPTFGRLVSVAVYGGTGDVYVADAESSVVDVFNAAGDYLSQLTAAAGEPFSGVAGVAVNQSTGQLYVGDTGRGTVDVFNEKDEYQSHFTGSETPGGSFLPFRDAVDSSTGEVYVADLEHGVVDVFSAAGEYLSQFNGSATPPAEFFEPYGLSVNPSTGQVYVADQSHGAVDVFKGLPLPNTKTEAATAVEAETAELNGVVNAEGVEEVLYHFEYSTNAAFEEESTVNTPEISDTTVGDVPVHAAIAGLKPGTLYNARLSATSKNGTVHGRDQSFVTAGLAPVIASASASNVSSFAATLSGTIVPGGIATSYHFVYGTTAVYGQSTRTEGVGGLQEAPVTPQRIGGLTPGTVYHFALIAENASGTTKTLDQTFTTTAAVAPLAVTGPASEVGGAAELLAASIDPQGLATTYSFEVGPTSAYGTVISGNAGSGQGAVSVSAGLTNLSPGTLFHYRVVARNAAGTTYGNDATFNTPAGAPGLPQPATPMVLPPSTFPIFEEPKTITPRKALTLRQRLAAALKACAKKPRAKRAACQKQARVRYGSVRKGKKT